MQNRLIHTKNISFDKIVYSIIGFLFFIDFLISFDQCENILIAILFSIIGIISYTEYIKDNRIFSINKFIMIYLFVFEYLAPFKQYLSKYNIWKLCTFTDSDYIVSLIVVLFFLVLYILGSRVLFKNVKNIVFTFGNKRGHKKGLKINDFTLIALVFGILLCLLYLYSTGQLINLGLSSGNSDGSDTIQIFMIVVIRFIPVASLLLYFFVREYGRICCSKILIIAFLGVDIFAILLIYFPLSGTIPRYFLFAVYIMIATIVAKNIKHKSLVLIGILIGFVYIFPAFNFFKYHNITEISNFALGGLDFNFNDYDAHQMLMTTIKYCNSHGYLYGLNILTGLLCFIPRSIWSSKLSPSGLLVAEYYNASFKNLSCPIYAEFYLAFGVLGVIFFTLVLSYLIKLYDKKMRLDAIVPMVINTIVMGMSIYIMRGALLPSLSYTYGMFLAVALVYFTNMVCTKIK